MADVICPCGQLIINRRGRQKFCSKKCCRAEAYRKSPRDKSETCLAEGCTRRKSAKGFCLAHYSAVGRREKTVQIVCEWCGATANVQPRSERTSRYCSLTCGSSAYNDHKKRKSKGKTKKPSLGRLKQCTWCFQLHGNRGKFCSDQCSSENQTSKELRKLEQLRLGRFRKSFITGDYVSFFEELKLRVEVNQHGCWIWQQQLKNGYPRINWTNKQVQVHRLVVEAKYGKPLGTQQAHHMCATPSCVNPDHLQPVTHRDNMAEMMQRRAYIDRIHELEQIISIELDPCHPVLNRIKIL